MMLFAMGLHSTIHASQGLNLKVWFADDWALYGATVDVERAMNHLSTPLPYVGMRLNLAKSPANKDSVS